MSSVVATSSAVSTLSLRDIEAQGDKLVSAVGKLMEEARAGSPEALTSVNELLDAGLQALLKPSNLCGLEVTDVGLGTHVSFTIPRGMSGKSVLDLIEKANPRSSGPDVVWPGSALLNDAGLKDIVNEDTKYTFIVCTNASNLTRTQQQTYLTERGLDSLPRWVLTVGAALFRDKMGFPTARSDIGTAEDKGDLLKGKVVRAHSSAVASSNHGLSGVDYRNYWVDDVFVIAGVALPTVGERLKEAGGEKASPSISAQPMASMRKQNRSCSPQ